jgi:phage-related protein
LSSPNSIDAKDVQFVGSAERDFGNLPDQIRKEAITALSDLQNGRIPKSGRYKELTNNDKLRGVGEIRLNGDDGNTYRVYNVICLREVIYVLDAGVKKSVRGGAIPQQDVERLEKRLKTALEDYRQNQEALKKAFEARQARKGAFEKKFSRRPKGV